MPPKPKKERDIRVDARNKLKVLFSEDPKLSIRKASVDAKISYSLCRDILLKDLQLHALFESSPSIPPVESALPATSAAASSKFRVVSEVPQSASNLRLCHN